MGIMSKQTNPILMQKVKSQNKINLKKKTNSKCAKKMLTLHVKNQPKDPKKDC